MSKQESTQLMTQLVICFCTAAICFCLYGVQVAVRDLQNSVTHDLYRIAAPFERMEQRMAVEVEQAKAKR
jgi:hypothetical protein